MNYWDHIEGPQGVGFPPLRLRCRIRDNPARAMRFAPLLPYLAAVLLVGLAALVRGALDPVLGEHLPYPTFFFAIAATALLAGARPALLATALGFLASTWFFGEHRGSLAIRDGLHAVSAAAYVGVGFAIVGLRWLRDRAERGRRTSEERLGSAHARLAAIVESSDDAIIGKTLDGIITSWNYGAERIFGYTAAEMIGQTITRLMPADRSDDMTSILGAIRRGERIDHFETQRMRKDGTRIDVSLRVSPIFGADGRILGASKIARDVTEQKQFARLREEREERIRELHDAQQAILRSMGEGFYTVDTDGTVTSLNPAAERIFGWTREELLGRKIHDVTHHQHPDGTPFPIEDCTGLQVLKSGSVLTDHEDVFIRKDGTFFPVVYSSAPLMRRDRIAGLVVVFRDMSQHQRNLAEREELLAAAQQARLEAEAANRAKDEFLSIVSHELRTPLASILTWLHVLRGGKGVDVDRALESMQRSAEAQTRLIDDLLDVTRIVSGSLRIEMQPVRLVEVVRAVLDTVAPAAEAKGVRFEAKLEDGGALVAGDPERLQQVTWNLLSNAIKFTPRDGSVRVTIEPTERAVHLVVRDTGQGIEPDFLPRVFDRFRQAEPAATRRQGGLGLGLAIVQNLVELHGGRVTAKSDGPGQGSTFRVTLPRVDGAAHVEVPSDEGPRPPLASVRSTGMSERRGVS